MQDTNYFEDELWKTETIENEAREILHKMHVSTNETRGNRINFTDPPPASVPFSIVETK